MSPRTLRESRLTARRGMAQWGVPAGVKTNVLYGLRCQIRELELNTQAKKVQLAAVQDHKREVEHEIQTRWLAEQRDQNPTISRGIAINSSEIPSLKRALARNEGIITALQEEQDRLTTSEAEQEVVELEEELKLIYAEIVRLRGLIDDFTARRAVIEKLKQRELARIADLPTIQAQLGEVRGLIEDKILTLQTIQGNKASKATNGADPTLASIRSRGMQYYGLEREINEFVRTRPVAELAGKLAFYETTLREEKEKEREAKQHEVADLESQIRFTLKPEPEQIRRFISWARHALWRRYREQDGTGGEPPDVGMESDPGI